MSAAHPLPELDPHAAADLPRSPVTADPPDPTPPAASILDTVSVETFPTRWNALPWCLVWTMWSVGTSRRVARALTERVALYFGVEETRVPSPTLLAVDDVDLDTFTGELDVDTLTALANGQRMWANVSAPTRAETVFAWAEMLQAHEASDLYRAMRVLDDPERFAEVDHALSGITGDRSGLRRTNFWTAVAACHQVRPDADLAAWLSERNPDAGELRPDDLRPMITRAAVERSHADAPITPRELDHALHRRRIIGP